MQPYPLPLQPLPIDARPCWVIGVSGAVRAGFPSPAESFAQAPIDISKLLIPHPQATFYFRVAGDSMVEAGLHDQDYVLVDRAVRPEPGHIVVAIWEQDFTIKYLRKRGCFYLEAANPTYPKMVPRDGQTLEIFGVARTGLHALPGFNIRPT